MDKRSKVCKRVLTIAIQIPILFILGAPALSDPCSRKMESKLRAVHDGISPFAIAKNAKCIVLSIPEVSSTTAD